MPPHTRSDLGVGMNIDPGRIDAGAISGFTKTAESQGGTVQFFLDIIPNTIVDAFAKGAMLQVIFISVMMGICLVQIGERGKPVVDVIDSLVQALFRFVSIVMRSAPIGAGAGVAYTIGRYGVGSLISLGLANAVCLHNITRVYSRYTGEYRAVVWFSAVTFSSLLQR